jgi:hypothetical protein
MSFYSNCGGAAQDITPSDTTELSAVSVIYVGVTGNIALVTANGDEVTLQNAQAGSVIPVRVKKVKATGTTATGLIALQ